MRITARSLHGSRTPSSTLGPTGEVMRSTILTSGRHSSRTQSCPFVLESEEDFRSTGPRQPPIPPGLLSHCSGTDLWPIFSGRVSAKTGPPPWTSPKTSRLCEYSRAESGAIFDFIVHGFIILKSRSRKRSLLRREFLHLRLRPKSARSPGHRSAEKGL